MAKCHLGELLCGELLYGKMLYGEMLYGEMLLDISEYLLISRYTG